MARRVLVLLFCLVQLAHGADAPRLTDVQKLQLQNKLQAVEIAQLRLQAAQVEFERARQDTMATLKGLAVPGYHLDLSTFMYTPTPKEGQPDEIRPAQ